MSVGGSPPTTAILLAAAPLLRWLRSFGCWSRRQGRSPLLLLCLLLASTAAVQAQRDFGDFSGFDNASSVVNPQLRMGATVTSEGAGQANTTATSDLDDGVTVPPEIRVGRATTLFITVLNNTGANAFFNSWLDVNGNGTLVDSLLSAGGERLHDQITVPSSSFPQVLPITFTVPNGAALNTPVGLRFRLTSTSNPGPTGNAGDGEVEDYLTRLTPAMTADGWLPTLEFASGAGNTTESGATIAPQVIALQSNPNNPENNVITAAEAPLNATFELLNQQYTPSTFAMPTQTGMSFASPSAAGAAEAGTQRFPLMNSISAPVSSQFTSAPFSQPGQGISAGFNRGVAIFTSADALAEAAVATTGRYYFGDLRVTFSRPTDFPVLHLVGIGAITTQNDISLGMTAELELLTPNVLLTQLSGSSELLVRDGTQILNRSNVPRPITGQGAASGSILVGARAVTTLTFRVFMRGDGGLPNWASGSSGTGTGDLWLVGFSEGEPDRDFGDAAAVATASSRATPDLSLGNLIDAERQALTNSAALGDDLDGQDDEDGLSLPADWMPGQTVTITAQTRNRTGSNARLNVWIDFDGNGQLTGPSEHVIADRLIGPSTSLLSHSLSVTIPANAPSGYATLRARLTSALNAPPTGFFSTGEVEDYRIWIGSPIVLCPASTVLPRAVQGLPYDLMLTPSGGTGPYLYQITSGSLPSGLTLNANTGRLSGSPSSLATSTFTLRITDSQGIQSSRTYQLQVIATASIVNATASENNVPITAAKILRNGANLVIQSSSASGSPIVTNESLDLTELSILDAGLPRTLSVTNRGGGTISQIYVSPSSTVHGVANQGNVQSIASLGLEPFRTLAAATASNSNLNHYLDDSNGDQLPDGNPEYDFLFNLPFQPTDYVIMSERFGNSTARLTPLDASGQVIPGSNPVQFGPPYDWNTGFASSVQTGQPYWLTCIRASTFGVTQPIYGFRIDTRGADVKFFGMSETGFTSSPAPPASLGDRVWADLNGNGIQDPQEPGMPGIPVDLVRVNDGAVIRSTTTDASGHYRFENIGQGNYRLRFTPSAFYRPTLLSAGSDRSLDSDVDPASGQTAPFSLLPCETRMDLDAGLVLESCPPLTLSPSTLTNASEDLPYTAEFIAAGGLGPYVFTLDAGTLPPWATLDNATGLLSGTPTAAGAFTFSIRATDRFGCSITQSYTLTIDPRPNLGIGNLIFLDQNDNGHYDPGEGVPNVPVELYSSLQFPGIDTPLDTTLSGPDGSYYFGDLSPGLYKVHVPAAAFQPSGALEGTTVISENIVGDDDVGQNGINMGDPTIVGVSTSIVSLFLGTAPTGSSGETGFNSTTDDHIDAAIDLTIDFGFRLAVGVGNLVFIDTNRNGRFDSGEGVANVRVELYRASDEPGVDLPILVQNTQPNGVYFFDQLLPGDYRLFIPPSQFAPGAPLEGTLSLTGTQINADDDAGENGIDDFLPQQNGIRTDIVTLQRGSQPTDSTFETGAFNTMDNRNDANFNLTVDFGFAAVDPTEVGVGNLVFIDQDGNGRYDPGEGIAGVIIQLFPAGANPQTDIPTDQILTSTGGLYLFRGLVEGSYFVHIPASQFQPNAPLAGLKSIPGAGGDWGIDDDFDENGIDAPEPELTGVSSTTFELIPGTEPTNDWGEFGQNFEMDDANDANFDLTIDLGFSQPVGVGNLVFFDANANGKADPGEGLADITVQLFPAGAQASFDLPIAELTTDSNGFFLFTDLSPGSYFLHLPFWQFTPGQPLAGLQLLGGSPDGDDDVGQNGVSGGDPASFGISSTLVLLEPGTAPAGDDENGLGRDSDDANDANIDLTIDFGFAPPASLGDLVFHDVNGDGLRQPNGADGLPNTADDEIGLAGVSLELWSPGPDGLIGGGDDFIIDASALTNGHGLYSFSNLPSGAYYIIIPDSNFGPGGTLQLLPSASAAGAITDTGVDNHSHGTQPNGRATATYSPIINLGSGQNRTSVDFGFIANVQPLTWAEWQQRNSALADVSPTGNSDGDQYSNLAEFALGLKASSGVLSRQPLRIVHDPVTGQIDLAVDRVTDLASAAITLQVLADLTLSPSGWSDVTSPLPIIQHRNDGTEEALYQNVSSLPQLFGSSGFARLKITLDTDQNGTPEATTYSPVIGWARRTFGTHLQTLCHSFANPPLLVGSVQATADNTLILTNALNGLSISELLTDHPAYHLEVLSGPLAGNRLEVHIASSQGSAIAIDTASPRNTMMDLPTSLASLVNAQVALRPHLTLGALADHTLFRGTNNPATADRLLFYHPANNSFRSYWLAAFGQTRSWLLQGSSDLVDQSHLIIDPDRGLFIHPRFQPVTLLLQGYVRPHPFALTLKTNLNFSANGWPLPLSPAQLSMFHPAGFVGAGNAASSDQIQRWRGDAAPGNNTFDGFFYLRSGSLFNQWTRSGDASLPNLSEAELFQPHTATFIRSVNRLPCVLLPMPWQP
jgi:hypothetical protein